MTQPTIQYLQPGDPIAYTVQGRGAAFVYVPHLHTNHLRAAWEVPGVSEFFGSLALRRRVVRFDPAGTGMSPAGEPDLTVEGLAGQVLRVFDGLGIDRGAVYGEITGGLPAIAFAAQYPERVTHLVLWCSFARDADHGTNPRLQSLFSLIDTDWELFTESICQAATGWQDARSAHAWATAMRESSTPEQTRRLLAARREWNVLPLLSEVSTPTLVLHDTRNQLASEDRSRELAAGIPGAHLQFVTGRSGMPGDGVLRMIDAFLRGGTTPAPVVAGERS